MQTNGTQSMGLKSKSRSRRSKSKSTSTSKSRSRSRSTSKSTSKSRSRSRSRSKSRSRKRKILLKGGACSEESDVVTGENFATMDPNNRLEVPSGQAGKEFCFDINALEKEFVKYTRRKNWYTNTPFSIDQLSVIRKFWTAKFNRIPVPSSEAERAEFVTTQIGRTRYVAFDDVLHDLTLVEIQRLEREEAAERAIRRERSRLERLLQSFRAELQAEDVARRANRFRERLDDINQEYDYNNQIKKYVQYYGYFASYIFLLYGISVSADEFLRLVERLIVLNIPVPSF